VECIIYLCYELLLFALKINLFIFYFQLVTHKTL